MGETPSLLVLADTAPSGVPGEHEGGGLFASLQAGAHRLRDLKFLKTELGRAHWRVKTEASPS